MVKKHLSATGIVFNAKNEILLIKHKKLKVWLPPGGHIDENELPEEAVLREIKEESGVIARILSHTKQLPLTDGDRCRELETPFTVLLEDVENNGTHYHIDFIFICEAVTDDLVFNSTETDEIGWFGYDQIQQMETFDNVIKVIAAALSERKQL